MDLTIIIWMFALGAAIAACMMYYNSRFLGGLVRKLLEIDATAPESAMTLEELNIKLTPALKRALRPGTSFSDTVLTTADGRYYIAPDKVSMAKAKYRGKDVDLLYIILILVIIGISAAALTNILPKLIDGSLGYFSEAFSGGKDL